MKRTPINPADIRVGDRVERVYVSGDHETIERFTVESVAHRAVSSCRLSWGIEAPRVGTAEWFLLDRPDPLAEVVAEATRALWRYYEVEGEADPEPDSEYSMAYRSAARTVICCSTQSGCPVGCRFCGAGITLSGTNWASILEPNPEIGLTNADLALARTWALGLPVALACPECGYYRDTPNHEFGCGR